MGKFCFALVLAMFVAVACALSVAVDQKAAATSADNKTSPSAQTPAKPKTPANPKPDKKKVDPPCPDGQEEIPLGVLSGSEADSLASTLSSVFGDNYIVTSKATSPEGGSGEASDAGSKADSSGAAKHLCLAERTHSSKAQSHLTKAKAKRGSESAEDTCTAATARCDIDKVLSIVDRDSFKGVTLNSNFIIKLGPRLEASALERAMPHPTTDFDLKAVGDDEDRLLVAVPAVGVQGQASAVSALAKHAAALNQDILLLEAIKGEKDRRACSGAPCTELELERWLAGHTIVLSVLDARDVVLQLDDLFHGRHERLVASPRNHSVVVLPEEVDIKEGTYLAAGAIEQDVLYRRDQAAKAAQAALDKAPADKAAASKPDASATPTTETKSTTKTSVTPATKTSPPITTTNTATTTTVTPGTASASGASAGGKSSAGSGSSSGAAGDSGSGSSGQSATSTPTLKGWPQGAPFPMDRVQRLYHFRHATAIAAAINKASGSKDVDLVEAIGDNDDLLLILPPSTSDGHDPYGDIRRAIAMIDLPRPQLSLQVWSYEVSSEVKNKNRDSKSVEKQAHSLNEVQENYEGVRQAVLTANDTMTQALQNGFGAIVSDMKGMTPELFFDPAFYGYLTERYQDCVGTNRYCLGYRRALEVPQSLAGKSEVDASLSRLLLFLVAANDDESKAAVDDALKEMEDYRCKVPGTVHLQEDANTLPEMLCFPNFRRQLKIMTETRNLRVMRAALLDFFFQYKQLYVYFNDFVPYDLQRTAHEVDNLLNPIVNAFNADVDDFVHRTMDCAASVTPKECVGKEEKIKGLASKGMVQVSAISGTQAQVSGKVDNYFDITPPMSLSDILNPNQNAVSALKGILEPKEITLLTAVANMGSQARIHAQVSENAALTITPTALDTASSAELDVNFEVGEPTGAPPAAVDSTASKADILNRVADYSTATQIRVESLKLFQVSSFTMELTHPQRGAPIPLIGQAWEGLFGTMPGVDKLFHRPDTTKTIDNRAVAIVRAVVVPTAMDLGQSLEFDSDRVLDPITGTADQILSMAQIGGKVRPFHKKLIECVIKGGTDCWAQVKLSDMPEDSR
jgi:hypothetical protein